MGGPLVLVGSARELNLTDKGGYVSFSQVLAK